jgi:hypothetical protein
MLNILIKPKALQFFLAFSIAILTTGFLRLQLIFGLPESDGGLYTFISQYFYHSLSSDEPIRFATFNLYPLLTAWVYGLEVNQYILLRLIDGFVAVAGSIIFFKVILKESGSIIFSAILIIALLILMHNAEYVLYGFRNSIWAAYLPLFSALLLWQNATKEDRFSFYLIGGLVTFGVLLREPFLPFFLIVGIAILIGYGWRILFNYLIGSAVFGFTILTLVLMLREWDLLDLVNSYFDYAGLANQFDKTGFFGFHYLASIKTNWFIYITASISFFYLIKLYFYDKKSVCINRVCFWLAIAFTPLIEIALKIPFSYHYANLLPGLAGLTAIGWKYMSNQESKKINLSFTMLIGLMSLFVVLPKVSQAIIKSPYILSPSDAINLSADAKSFRSSQTIESNQYLITARKIYELSREDSTLSASGLNTVLFPLTGLLPPTYELHDLGKLLLKLNNDENKVMEIIIKHRPTLIITSGAYYDYELSLSKIIEKTNLYNKVETVVGNPKIQYGWKFNKPGIIYRLKDFQ